MTLLSVERVSKAFGGVKAVDGCSFAVEEGTVTGLIGPNGAGKSTAIEMICGGQKANSGKIVFDGQDITGFPRHKVASRGLVRTFQIARPFAQLPLMENVLIGRPNQLGEAVGLALFPPAWRREEDMLRREADSLLTRVGLNTRRDAMGSELSGGQQKLLEMARALMAKPKLLLLDEPIAGVNPMLAEVIANIILQLKKEGITILVVEHNLQFVTKVCDHVIVMAEGKVLTSGSMEEVRANREVVQAYLGGVD